MQFSDRFLNLVHQQLNSFENDAVLENVVVYIAQSNEDGDPTLEVVGQIPRNRKKVLPPIANDPDLRVPSPNRRWYPLQDGSVLLGVLRAERFSSEQGWPDVLDNRLQASANALSNYYDKLDKALVRPATRGYVNVVPDPFRRGLGNGKNGSAWGFYERCRLYGAIY